MEIRNSIGFSLVMLVAGFFAVSNCLRLSGDNVLAEETGGSVWEELSEKSKIPFSGRYKFSAEDVDVPGLEVEFPDLEIRDVSQDDGGDPKWKCSLLKSRRNNDVFKVNFLPNGRQRISYVIKRMTVAEDDLDTLIPILATETVREPETGDVLKSQQSLLCKIYDLSRDESHGIKDDMTVRWAYENPEELHSPWVIDACVEHLWHNQNLDSPPGSYNGIIRLNYRRIELNPEVIDPYTSNAWLLWSKWVTWKDDSEDMPDGEGRVNEAIEVLEKGRSANPDNPRYYYEAASIIMPLAMFHQSEKYEFVEKYYKMADNLAQDSDLKVKVRKALAHVYRKQGKLDKAREWYEKVLEIDEDNPVAKKYLRELSDGEDMI